MSILVTGNAGFIGFHTAKRLLESGETVIGLDIVNDYYDIGLKETRLALLAETAKTTNSSYKFYKHNLANAEAVNEIFEKEKPRKVIHLAAQAGVRHSLKRAGDYVESNLIGFTHILEACRHYNVEHLTYASTSSVYGGNTEMPYRESHSVDHPLQFYAATKRANELMAHAYSHLFKIPTTGLRFFTVYGPWGRPDMAMFLFTDNIWREKPIKVFNHGNHSRDFTYIDDIVEGILRVNDQPAQADAQWINKAPTPDRSNAPYRIYNIGNNQPVKLAAYIEAIELALGKKAVKEFLPMQPGDVPDTFADVSELIKAVGYKPKTNIIEGVAHYVDWYKQYYIK